MPTVLRFIEPCLPSPADRPPSGSKWIHEIKHDGYRLMARRDSVSMRLITRRGNDWSDRFPLVVEAVNQLKVRSCLIDGEVVCCDERGLARFDVLRRRRNEADAFLYAFDQLELGDPPFVGTARPTMAFNILNPDTFKPPLEIPRSRIRRPGYAVPAQSWSLRGSGDCSSCMSCRPSLKTCSI